MRLGLRSAVLYALLCAALLGLAGPAHAQSLQATQQGAAASSQLAATDDLQEAVFELVLDGHVLSDSLSAWQDGDRILLPLGELARLLTLAITVDAPKGQASGFIVREERGFGLNVAEGLVSVEGRPQQVDARDVRVIGDDIHVSHERLRAWLPLDIDVDLPTLQVRIRPRVKLPLQERLQRENARVLPFGAGDPDEAGQAYARLIAPVGAIGAPFIDQTFGSDARFGKDSTQYKTAYAAYITGDALGMEGEAYVSSSRERPRPQLRWTLSRNDPQGDLLGPLRARSLGLGHVVTPSVPQVSGSGLGGLGATLSNRPLGLPSGLDKHSIRGDLPPGWDVTLYYNEALVGYQAASGADGRYAFDDLPLAYGHNEFRLVFNGPLGQVRVERQSFLLDQAVMKPGELLYSVAAQQGGEGGHVGLAQLDLGLTRALSANVSVIDRARHTGPRGTREAGSWWQTGLRGHGLGAIAMARWTGSAQGGWLADVSLKTRIGRHAVFWEQVRRGRGFRSDIYIDGNDGLRRRDRAGMQGSVQWGDGPMLSLALEGSRDELMTRGHASLVAGRVSSLLWGTAVTQSMRWQRLAGAQALDGSLQLSRRVVDVGLSGQLDYGIRPHGQMRTIAFTADRTVSSGLRLTGGLLYSKLSHATQVSAGVSKTFGGVALALTAGLSNKGERTVGLQLFVAMGRDPRSQRWFAEPQPLAGTGAVSVQAFVDRNLNGQKDADEEAVPHAGVILNHGGRHPGRTDEQGRLLIGRLSPGQYADIALDPSTLEDPQWKPMMAGARVLPRPGLVQPIDFPVVYTAEVEGTVYLVDAHGRRRGIGDARLELLGPDGQVRSTTRSSSDGYYLLHQVMPGRATLRIAPDQASKLGLSGTLSKVLDIPADGDFLSGQDIELQLRR